MAPRLSSQHAIGFLLGALCLGLGALVAIELGDTRAAGQNQPPAQAAGNPPAASAAPKFSLPALQRFAVVTEHPLFSPDRKPPQHANDAAGAWSSFVLAGIIVTPESREVLVLHGKPQAVAHLQEGQALEGWTVTSIDPDRVVFRDGINEHELRLTPKAPPPNVATRPRLPIE
jgi:type II secretory pathway component PulC